MSTPSKPWRSSSRFSSVLRASSRSARQVLRGTSTTAGICRTDPKHVAVARGKRFRGMPTAYDEIPYANLPFTQALPRGHATVATLHGLTPPDPRTARVLELGCGAGAPLASIAAAHPEARAVGVDLAPTAIEAARATAAAAGLESVRFDVGDVLGLADGGLGEFDFVIVHGLCAGAAEGLREAVLDACRSHLA